MTPTVTERSTATCGHARLPQPSGVAHHNRTRRSKAAFCLRNVAGGNSRAATTGQRIAAGLPGYAHLPPTRQEVDDESRGSKHLALRRAVFSMPGRANEPGRAGTSGSFGIGAPPAPAMFDLPQHESVSRAV